MSNSFFFFRVCVCVFVCEPALLVSQEHASSSNSVTQALNSPSTQLKVIIKDVRKEDLTVGEWAS